MESKCPGQDSRKLKAETITCRKCGYGLEIFSDEITVRCPKCRAVARRENMPSCLDWCRYAEKCVGGRFLSRHRQEKAQLMKEKLLAALEDYFGGDRRRIAHAREVLRVAEEIMEHEKADYHIVVPAAILHDVGIRAAEEKYGSATGRQQEREGPPIAAEILRRHDFQKRDADEICAIIACHHSPGKMDTPNFRVLYDADRLVNRAAAAAAGGRETACALLTETGRRLAAGRRPGR